jgi:alpha-galactosidase
MVSSGLADAGYDFVDIDDCWMNAAQQRDPQRVGPARDADGTILPNKHFPDMKALTAYIHSKGLKAGIYTSPGPRTCGGFTGAWQHEAQDARTFADWGFDLLKYDWCSYGEVVKGDSLAVLQKPYKLMADLLAAQDRDMQLNLCQYGMGKVWQWGAGIGGQSWRTGGDLGGELNNLFGVALRNVDIRAWNGPGGWNDPDYIQIGNTGNADAQGKPVPFPLSPTEQYSFVSLWCLTASPLFYSGDLAHLEPFTLNALTNPEVIAVDQDPLGQCAASAMLTDQTFLLIKDLADGSKAVGLCNRGEFKATITAPWPVLGLQGPKKVRDLWRQKDLGPSDGQFTADVPRHGVMLIRIEP